MVMQMFGRVLRSGQVVKPSYEIFSLALPAEKRPTMVLAKKMRSLNANTSANAKGNIDLGVDVLNKYGDIIAAEYISSHDEIAKATGIDLEYDKDGNAKTSDDLMRKFLGKVAVLPNDIQEKIYRDITEEYNEYVEQLKATGEYDLELESHDDWDVQTDESETVVSGNDQSIFTSPVIRKGVRIKVMRNIPSADFVKRELQNAFDGKNKKEVITDLEKKIAPIRKAIDKIDSTVWEGKDDKFIYERKNMNKDRVENFLSWVNRFFDKTLAITIGEETFYGVISDIKVSDDIDPKNPAMNAFKVRFTIGDNITHLTYNFRQILSGKPFVAGTFMRFNDIFTGEKQEIREDRQIFTGNILKAYELIGDKGSGKVVTYMTSDGNRETGILMAKKWKVGEMSRDPRNELETPEAAFDELERNTKVFTTDGNLAIFKRTSSDDSYYLVAAKKRSEGGKYFLDENLTDITGDFYSSGQTMRVNDIHKSEVKKLIDYLYQKGKLKKVNSNGAVFSTVGDRKQSIEEINQNFNDDLDRQIAGTLPKGYIHQLGTPGDILLSTGVPNLPIELSATRLEEKSKQENHPFNIADLKNLPKMLQKPIGVFSYGNKDNAQNIIIEVQQNGRNFLIGLSFNFEHDGLIVNSIRGLFAKETAFWLRWIEQGKTLYIDKEKVQKLIAQQRTNFADVNNLDLNSINNIIQNFENPSLSAKKNENSSTDSAFSLTGDLGDTSLSPIDYRRSIDPLFDFVMEYTDNGVVNPGREHEGEYFTGSFISSEFVAYSEKKPQGRKQSDAQYQQYLARRERALNTAEGTPLDEIAAAYVRKFGGDEKEIAERILDMLRDLTKRDLISDRAEAKREVAEHEKEQRKEDKAEYAKMKDAELTNQVNELFESKEPVTVDKRWVPGKSGVSIIITTSGENSRLFLCLKTGTYKRIYPARQKNTLTI